MTESPPAAWEQRLEPTRQGVRVPEGYRETDLYDPFEAYVGPFFDKTVAASDGRQTLWMAFWVDERHLNGAGFVHGGMLMTFADATLGACAWRATNRAPSVTLSMQVDFMKGAKEGDLIEVETELVRKTRTILFIRGTFFVRGEAILTASSLWKLLKA